MSVPRKRAIEIFVLIVLIESEIREFPVNFFSP